MRGGWSKNLMMLRLDIIKNFIIDDLKLVQLDIKRQISDDDKIKLFNTCDRKCEKCGHLFEDHREPKYHHKIKYAAGGPTNLYNIQVLCGKCHIEAHRTESSDD